MSSIEIPATSLKQACDEYLREREREIDQMQPGKEYISSGEKHAAHNMLSGRVGNICT